MMKFLLPLMLALATCWAGIPSRQPLFESVAPELIQQEVPDSYKLPTNVVPHNYDIELTPYLVTDKRNFSYSGKSVIELEVKEITKTITFHASKQLELTEYSLEYFFKLDNEILTIPLKQEDIIKNTNVQKDFVILNLKSEIPVGKAKLTLKYEGPLSDNLRGFYKSSYQDGKKTRYLATTHFEPVGARQAFPCWDEPALKATFKISINTENLPKDYHVVSNMLEKSEKDGWTRFDPTPVMSTYLVAFVVSDYESNPKDANTKENVRIRVWTRPNAVGSTDFALKIGKETVNKLSKFTGIDYTESKMQKLDQITIPDSDFTAGAMENWGLVTYRESALLYDEDKTTTQDKQSIATVIAHEFSHQWFGNLVTCAWWDYIWLNEGFATFFQYFITEQVVEESNNEDDGPWRLMEQFAIKNLQASAFVVDATSKTRPLNPEISVQTPAQIHSLFDDIAYKKGGSILRMLQQFLTEKIFQNGLSKYLNDNKNKPVTPDNLFTAIELATGKAKLKTILPKGASLKDVMKNWLNKPGYPVVTVTRETGQPANSTEDILKLTQKRFFLKTPAIQDTTQWYIPLTYVTEGAPDDTNSAWLTDAKESTLSIKIDKKSTWVLFNLDQTGYYRVNYNKENWESLARYLNTDNYNKISPINRAQLIDDALNLAQAGDLSYDNALKITEYLKKEVDYIPWYAAVRAFDYLNSVLVGTENYENYRAYVVQRIEKFAKDVDYKDPEKETTHIGKLSKVLALNTACKYGYKDCEEYAAKTLGEWLEDKEGKKELSPDLRSGIICAGLRKANEETWNKVKDKYKDSKDEDVKANIKAGLGCATNQEIVKKFLDSTVEKDSDFEIFDALNSVSAGSAQFFDTLLKFIKDNIKKIKEADTNDTELVRVLNKLASKVTNEKQYVELSILAQRHLQEFEKFSGLAQAIENLDWVRTHGNTVKTWIAENYKQDNSNNAASSFTLASFLVLIPILLARFH